MPGKVDITDTGALPSAIREIQEITRKVERACGERLRQWEGTLQQTRQEESVSRGLLETAKAAEAAAAANRAAADARMTKALAKQAAAIASGNPVLIAAAGVEVAAAAPPLHKAVELHNKAVTHRRRLKQRHEEAVTCVHLAQDTLDKLRTAFQFGCGAVKAAAFPGVGRLTGAYEKTREYLASFSPSASFSIPMNSGPITLGPITLGPISPGSITPSTITPGSMGLGSVTADAAFAPSTPVTQRQDDFGADLSDEDASSLPGQAFGQPPNEPLSDPQSLPPKEVPSGESLDGVVRYTDDNGKLYRLDNDLLPNTSYELNGYRYQTDQQGRVVSAEGTLHLKSREGRLTIRDSIEDIGKGDQRPGDDRGHLIGDQFDGVNRLENLIPQNADINQRDFRSLENQLAAEVRKGKSVQVRVEPLYNGDSHRPDAVVVTYSMDGGSKEVVFFPNPSQGSEGRENGP